ncbi:MAG: nucleotide exchange factor GrpE [Phycisphaerae bacterium]|jgi:molecular chaperone GrpE
MNKKHKQDDSAEPASQPSPDQPAAAAPREPAGDLDKLQAERDDLLARLQRVSAEFMNYQKRVQRDITEAREYANADLIKSFLVVLDDMDRGLKAAMVNHAADDPLLVGMELVYNKAFEILGRYGLSVIKAEGEHFDPEKHSALMQQPSDKCPPNTVLTELQRGFQLKGRTIRPAAVVVSKLPDEAGETAQESGEK